MAKDKTIHLLIIHQQEEEAERILSILRNAQIHIRPSRCITHDCLNESLANNKVDIILVHELQTELPMATVNQYVKKTGKDIPIIALLDNLNNDNISESYEAGIKYFCTDKIHEQLCSEVSNIFKSLNTRRDLRRYEAELNDAEKRCSSLLDSSKDAIAYIHDGMHVYTNAAYLEFFQYDDQEEMEVTPFLNLVGKEQVASAKKLLRNISAGKLPDDDIEMILKTESGEEIKAVVSLNKATVDGEPCVQFLVRPPSANKEAEKELQNIKNKDLLTGFYNRTFFHSYLTGKINNVRARKSKGSSLLYIQIDDDTELEQDLGKGNLDLLVSDIAPFIKGLLGKSHTYVRYDNTIFIVELKTEIEKASQIASHIVKKITNNLFNAGEKTINCSVSIGLTQIIEKTESSNDIIKILGDELLKAQENGGSQISVFDPAEEEKKSLAANQVWIDLITTGIKEEQFILHYQPVINLQGSETEYYETLVRLQSNNKLIMPADFIGVAKKHGFILDIDKVVIKNSIKAIKNSNKNVALFVKMSTDTLSNSSFPSWLAQELKKAAIPGNKLIFEMAESELVSHSKQVKPVIQAIKGLNCKFTIEKFGSGLNSFGLLKHYPTDYIKIDSAFMTDFATNEENQNKVKDIIDHAHAQNKIVICEFVQDATTMSILWKLSANFVQGNFLAPASPKMTQES